MWTKDELKKIMKTWESSTIEEIAEEIGVKKHNIQGVVSKLRKHGAKLPFKHRVGYLDSLVKEVVKETR